MRDNKTLTTRKAYFDSKRSLQGGAVLSASKIDRDNRALLGAAYNRDNDHELANCLNAIGDWGRAKNS